MRRYRVRARWTRQKLSSMLKNERPGACNTEPVLTPNDGRDIEMASPNLRRCASARKYRHHSSFIQDHKAHSTPLDRNARARILALAESLERTTKQTGKRNGVLGQTGVLVLKTLVMGFQNSKSGLCCPSVRSLSKRTGLAVSTVCEALSRLEAAGIIRRVRRIVRAVIDVCGMARLTTVQTSNLYAFAEPAQTAHLLPVSSARRAASPVVRLLAGIVKSATFEPIPASGNINPLPQKQDSLSGVKGSSAAERIAALKGVRRKTTAQA